MRSPAIKITRASLTVIGLAFGLTACGARPSGAVLTPVGQSHIRADTVGVIVATNRASLPDGKTYGGEWATSLSAERFDVSVPLNRNGTEIDYAVKGRDLEGRYFVVKRTRLPSENFASAIVDAPDFDGTIAIYVHGYNNSYQEALFRTAQMAADVPSAVPPILFAWPSAASVLGYVADKDAATYSRTQLTAVLEAVAKSSKVKRIILLGHSMGGFLSMEAARQLRLKGETKTLEKLQILLASPDIDVDVFRSQLLDVGELVTPITVLVSKSDRALIVSSVLAGERERVGKVDIDDPIVEAAAKSSKLRVVDISSLQSFDGFGHDRFATFARIGGRLIRDDNENRKSIRNVGAFVLDAAESTVSRPYRAVSHLVRH